MKALFTVILLSFFSLAMAQDYFMLIGTYTSGGSNGIYVHQFNSVTAITKLIDSIKITNPSYLTVSPNKKFVYAVSEDANDKNMGGKVSSFSFDNIKGSLSLLNEQPSNGNHPCYITIDKTGRWIITANYSSGTLAVLPVRSNGSLDTAVTTIKHTGQSVNTDRQTGPHVHATVLSPDNLYLFVPDLGLDKLMQYRFDKRNGALKEANDPYVMTKPGSGPRHFEFHPNKKYAYLVEELTGSVSAYTYTSKTGKLALIQNISTLPPDFLGYAGSADIHISPDGNFLYVSNRGESNSIVIYSINKKNGSLSVAGYQPTLGKTPRHFSFDPGGNFLLAANQNSNEIIIFKVNKITGLLSDTGKRISVSKPVCIKWIKKK